MLVGKAMLTAAVMLAAGSCPDFATAQEAPKDKSAAGCDQLSWSVARERAWFNDAKLTHRTSGARLRKIDRAVELGLEPTKKVEFFLPARAYAEASQFRWRGDVLRSAQAGPISGHAVGQGAD